MSQGKIVSRSMKLSDFNYYLPKELIAQEALTDRGNARLLVLNRATGEIKHDSFQNCIDYFKPGDVLVLNDTKVLPARLFAKKKTGGVVEVLLLSKVPVLLRTATPRGEPRQRRDRFQEPNRKNLSRPEPVPSGEVWEALLRPSGRVKSGQTIFFTNQDGQTIPTKLPETFTAEVLDSSQENSGIRRLQFEKGIDVRMVMERMGRIPLPPYIDREDLPIDREFYQTVYAKNPGSVASPTAGLHFTPELLEQLQSKGVELVFITLHVGYGTFQLIVSENLSEHKMHAEYFEISEEGAQKINAAKRDHRRVIACGTTSVRALESAATKGDRSCPPKIAARLVPKLGRDFGPTSPSFVAGLRRSNKDSSPFLLPKRDWANLFIYPPYEFKIPDAIITNFHLPKTTLLMLVAAFCGKENLESAYQEAIRGKYRFYSYGDAMLII